MVRLSLWQQGGELFPNRFDDVWLDGGHGLAPSHWEAWTTPQMIEYSVLAFHADTPRSYWRRL
jgi:hypothetical protein